MYSGVWFVMSSNCRMRFLSFFGYCGIYIMFLIYNCNNEMNVCKKKKLCFTVFFCRNIYADQ